MALSMPVQVMPDTVTLSEESHSPRPFCFFVFPSTVSLLRPQAARTCHLVQPMPYLTWAFRDDKPIYAALSYIATWQLLAQLYVAPGSRIPNLVTVDLP